MRVVIISGGELGEVEFIKSSIWDWDFIICADGGARYLELLGMQPDLLVGDFDSVSPELLEKYSNAGIPIDIFPKDKDWTDTQIAVDLAIDKGATQIELLGALGSRFDHSYANVMLLRRMESKGVRGRILHSHSTILVSNNILELEGSAGQIVSLLPLGGDVLIEYTQGLSYSLIESELSMEYPIGVSNILTSNSAIVKIRKGWAMAVLTWDIF